MADMLNTVQLRAQRRRQACRAKASRCARAPQRDGHDDGHWLVRRRRDRERFPDLRVILEGSGCRRCWSASTTSRRCSATYQQTPPPEVFLRSVGQSFDPDECALVCRDAGRRPDPVGVRLPAPDVKIGGRRRAARGHGSSTPSRRPSTAPTRRSSTTSQEPARRRASGVECSSSAPDPSGVIGRHHQRVALKAPVWCTSRNGRQ
jgi:hypothetical protein